MVVEAEMMGDLVTGAGLAGAVEPHSAATAHAHDDHCLNCGEQLVGPHCHRCGQAGHVHRTVGGFLHEIAHGVFHFEGKFWRTLPLLAFKPGHLTRRYIDGERAKFVSPVAMFLFTVFLMFTIVSNLSPAFDWGDAADTGGIERAAADIARETARARETVARLERERAATARSGGDLADATRDLADARREFAALSTAARALPVTEETSPKVRAEINAAPGARPASPSEAATEDWLEARVAHARENPKLTVYKMKTAAYKFSWALIPLSLPFLWLMFAWRRHVGLYDHAVFATYSLSFMSLLIVVITLLNALPSPGLAAIGWIGLILIPPVHMYKQLRHGYRLRRFSAAWRTAALLMVTSVTTTLFSLLLLYIGVAD